MVVATSLVAGAPAIAAAAEVEPSTAGDVVVPGNDPDNPNIPTPAEVAAEVAPDEPVTINVAVQLDDGNVRIDTREAQGPQQAMAVIADAAAEPDVVAAGVAVPVESLAGDPYRVNIATPQGLYPGQYGLSMMCTDSVALTAPIAGANCQGYSYQYATGAGQVIAILDEPVQSGHPDLKANALDAVSCLNNPCVATTYNSTTAAQHGTHVAGIAAAVTDNGVGIAGQAKGAKLLPVTVINKGGTGNTTALARGIAYATAAGVDVMNMSVAFYADDPAVKSAVNAALAKGIALVASVGNQGTAASVTFPAAYPGVVGVGAVVENFTAWSNSSRGSWVDVVAPGAELILSTWPSADRCLSDIGQLITTGYCYQAGTSMAAPYVSGLVAQILQINPTLSPTQVESLLTRTARDLGAAGRDNTYGYGFVDSVKALQQVPRPPNEPTKLSYAPGDGIVTMGFQPPSQTSGLTVLRYEYSTNGGAWTTAANGRTASPLSLTATTAGGPALINGQDYSVRLRAVTGAGPGTASAALVVRPSVPVPAEFVAIDPVRVYDSRWASSADTSGLVLGPLADSSVTPRGRIVPVRNARDQQSGAIVARNAVPTGATAVAYNLTVAGQTTSGFLSVTPGTVVAAPNTSTINWTKARQTRANGFISAVDGDLQLRVFGGGKGTTQFIVDVVGFYRPGATALADPSQDSVFVPLARPARAYDSRWKSVPGVTTGTITGPATRDINVKDARNSSTGAVLTANVVPTGATGVAYNVTITATKGTGFLAMAPGGQVSRPAVSTINWTPGITTANATNGKISADRNMRVFAEGGSAGGSTEFIVDIVGYFVPSSQLPPGVSGSKFVPLPPLRAYDSRSYSPGGPLAGNPTTGAVGPGRTTSAGLDRGVPTGATAVAFNLTITGNTGTGYLEVTPGGSPSTGTSLINWFEPTTIANGSTVGVNQAREQTSYVGGRFATQYLIDVAGYYRPFPSG